MPAVGCSGSAPWPCAWESYGDTAILCLGTLLGDPTQRHTWGPAPPALSCLGPYLGTVFRDPTWGPAPSAMPCSGNLFGAELCRGRGTFTPAPSQVRHNLLSVSYSVMADLRRETQRLKGQGDAEPGQPGQGKHRDIPYIQGTARPPTLPWSPQGSTLMPRVSSPGSAVWYPPGAGLCSGEDARCLPGAGSPAPPPPPPAGGHRSACPAPPCPRPVHECEAPHPGMGSPGDPGWG